MSTTLLFQILVAAIGGFIAFVFMLVHPMGPGLILIAVTPFDALFVGLFGIAGNAVTFIPIIGTILRSSGQQLVSTFLGTRIQVTLAIFIVLLSVSHALLVQAHGVAGILEYLRKITTLLLVGVMARYMKRPDHLVMMNKTLIISMAAFMTLSLLDFYLGIRFMPGAADTYGGALGLTLDDLGGVHALRFFAGGISVNQTANWLLMPIFLTLGWYLSPERSQRSLALLCGTVLVAALAATISRSGMLGLAVGIVILVPSLGRLNGSQVALGALGGAVALVAAYVLVDQVGFLDAFQGRFVSSEEGGLQNRTGRMVVFLNAFNLFLTSPLIGIGDSMTSGHPDGIGLGAHNSLLGLLSEAGILGTVPFIILVVMVVTRLQRSLGPNADPVYEHWRPFFLAGYVACFTQSMFNEYTWERLTWYGVAFAVAIASGAPYRRVEQAAEPGAFGTQGDDGAEQLGDRPDWSAPPVHRRG